MSSSIMTSGRKFRVALDQSHPAQQSGEPWIAAQGIVQRIALYEQQGVLLFRAFLEPFKGPVLIAQSDVNVRHSKRQRASSIRPLHQSFQDFSCLPGIAGYREGIPELAGDKGI